MKKILLNLMLMSMALIGQQAMAAIPSGYYNTALGKSDRELMLSLHQKINNHYEIYYRNLFPKFQTTDCNNNIIIDRYTDVQYTYQTDQCGTYNSIGDCYNREHSVPNSWWGGGKADSDTMYSDLFHIYPVDGWVNAERGNYPFGDCANGSARGTGKLGSCTHSGYSGTVFEVADEYKGDFARSYFYMVVRYMHQVGSWTQDYGNAVFTSSSYKHLTPWAISQLLEWHRNDPVSTLESNRNEAVYGIQHNRNPFIDHPELAEFLWGNRVGTAWTGSASTDPVISSPTNGSTINVGTNTGNGVSKSITVQGVYLTQSVTVAVTGTGFSVSPSTLTAAAVNSGTTITVTYNGTATNATGRLTISSSEVSSSVTLTANYNPGGSSGETEVIETWEGCTANGNYSATSIHGHAFDWNVSNVGLYAGDEHSNGQMSCRYGKNNNSYIEMAEDFADGASKISFYAAKWSSSEANPTLQVLYSTNGGSTWTAVGTCSPTLTWQQFIFNLNVTGNVRFKIAQTAGARLNIDDIAITSNSAPVPNPQITAPVNGSTVDVGTIDATGTSVSKTITVKGTDLSKNLSVSVTGTGFSVAPNIILAANANAGTTVTVTYTSSTPGDATGTLTIGSNEASVTVNLTASKVAMPTITITSVDAMEAELGAGSSIVRATVSADNNDENITLTVDGNFVISLNRLFWSKTLTLDPSGEEFYIRLADTGTAGEYYGTLTASTSLVNAYADVQGTVTGQEVLLGDVNIDGQVNVTDVTLLISYQLGNAVSPFDTQAADFNEDGVINITDVTMLINYVLSSSKKCAQHWDAVPVTGGILVDSPAGEVIEVYDMDGNCNAVVLTTGDDVVIDLPAGIYVVATDDASRKVVVK